MTYSTPNWNASGRASTQKRSGFTLTEIAIVLGILGVVLSAIWVAAARVANNQKVAKAATQILSVVAAIQTQFPNGSIPGGHQDITQYLINSGAFSADMLVPCTGLPWPAYGNANGCAVNPWGAQIHVDTQSGYGGSSPSPSYFAIWMTYMSQRQCVALISAIIGQAAGNGLVWAYSDSMGGMNISAATPITAFGSCSGGVGLQFQL